MNFFNRTFDDNKVANFNAVLNVDFSNEDADEPVTLSEAKKQCIIEDDETYWDDTIKTMITTARMQCENYSGLSLINRTVKAHLNNSCGKIYLPYGPVKHGGGSNSDSDEVVQGLDNEGDGIDICVGGGQFPQLDTVRSDVYLVYNTGYGILPQNLKQAILQQVLYLYEHRGDETGNATLSPMAKTILKPLMRK